MTEGTSQGVFIVVAIVIFSIFVGISYTLFGDTLRPSMIEMFNTSFNMEDNENITKAETSTWLWKAEYIKTEPDAIIDFLRVKKVGTVYVQMNLDVRTKYYQYFIEEATKEGIKVEILGGGKSWVDTKDRTKSLAKQNSFYAWVDKYQKASNNNQKFSGIHLDIEPYADLDAWENNRQETVEYYQEAIDRAVTESGKQGLNLTLDIPFWFDKIAYDNPTQGKGFLFDWLLDSGANELAIMAFRDKAEGSDSILYHVKSDFEKAEKKNVKISVSVETDIFSAAENKLTFQEEGEKYMFDELKKVKKALKNSPSYSGFSIHHVLTWRELKK